MFVKENTVSAIKEYFFNSLKDLYPKLEVESFFHILCDYFLGYSRVQVAMSLDKTMSESELLKFHYAIKDLKKQCDLEVSLITLSDQGVAIFDNDLRIHPTVAIEVFDVKKLDLPFLNGNYFEGKKDGLFECFSREDLELSNEEENKYYDARDFESLYETKIYEVHYENGKLIEE